MPRTRCFAGLLVAAMVVASPVALKAQVLCANCAFGIGFWSPTLAEQVSDSTDVVLAEWVGGVRPKTKSVQGDGNILGFIEVDGRTRFRVMHARGGSEVAIATEVELDYFVEGAKGRRFLLLNGQNGWSSSGELTDAGFEYVAALPAADAPMPKRLEYFLPFLEADDPLVAEDAYLELSYAAGADLKAIAGKLPRRKLREWIATKEPSNALKSRLGFYGLLLGIHGDVRDAELLWTEIKSLAGDENGFLRGMDNMLAGYLLLTSYDGLASVEIDFLLNDDAPFSDTYAAVRAVRFMANNGDGRIDRDRLCRSLRMVLDRPDLADLVIPDLAEWKDWSIRDRLRKIFDEADADSSATKRAIVRYFLACERDLPADAKFDPPHVADAKRHLAELRRADPKLVAEVERFDFVEIE